MQRQVCWTERNTDGEKCEVRVSFFSRRLKWQFKRASQESWDYDSVPTAEQWDMLAEKVEQRYRRRSASYEDTELVRRLRAEALGASR